MSTSIPLALARATTPAHLLEGEGATGSNAGRTVEAKSSGSQDAPAEERTSESKRNDDKALFARIEQVKTSSERVPSPVYITHQQRLKSKKYHVNTRYNIAEYLDYCETSRQRELADIARVRALRSQGAKLSPQDAKRPTRPLFKSLTAKKASKTLFWNLAEARSNFQYSYNNSHLLPQRGSKRKAATKSTSSTNDENEPNATDRTTTSSPLAMSRSSSSRSSQGVRSKKSKVGSAAQTPRGTRIANRKRRTSEDGNDGIGMAHVPSSSSSSKSGGGGITGMWMRHRIRRFKKKMRDTIVLSDDDDDDDHRRHNYRLWGNHHSPSKQPSARFDDNLKSVVSRDTAVLDEQLPTTLKPEETKAKEVTAPVPTEKPGNEVPPTINVDSPSSVTAHSDEAVKDNDTNELSKSDATPSDITQDKQEQTTTNGVDNLQDEEKDTITAATGKSKKPKLRKDISVTTTDTNGNEADDDEDDDEIDTAADGDDERDNDSYKDTPTENVDIIKNSNQLEFPDSTDNKKPNDVSPTVSAISGTSGISASVLSNKAKGMKPVTSFREEDNKQGDNSSGYHLNYANAMNTMRGTVDNTMQMLGLGPDSCRAFFHTVGGGAGKKDIFGKLKTSILFDKIFCTIRHSAKYRRMKGVCSPTLLGTTGKVKATVVSIIPHIIQYHVEEILKAKSEVLLATNYWQISKSSKAIVQAFRDLDSIISAKKAKAAELGMELSEEDSKPVLVKILLDHPTFKTFMRQHNLLSPQDFAIFGIPNDFENILIEVQNQHRSPLGTFHAKFLIVDHKVALVSSNNIQDRPNLEMMVHLEGGIVNSIYDQFLFSWNCKFKYPMRCLKGPIQDPNSVLDRIRIEDLDQLISFRGAAPKTLAEFNETLKDSPNNTVADSGINVSNQNLTQKQHLQPTQKSGTTKSAKVKTKSLLRGVGANRLLGRKLAGIPDPTESESSHEGTSPENGEEKKPEEAKDTEEHAKQDEQSPAVVVKGPATATPAVKAGSKSKGKEVGKVDTLKSETSNVATNEDNSTRTSSNFMTNVQNHLNLNLLQSSGAKKPKPVKHLRNGSVDEVSPSLLNGSEEDIYYQEYHDTCIIKKSEAAPLGPNDIAPLDPTVLVDGFFEHSKSKAYGIENVHDITAVLNQAAFTKVEPEVDQDFIESSTPFIYMVEHDDATNHVPMALACRKPKALPGHTSLKCPQNLSWMTAIDNAKHEVFIQTPTFNASAAIKCLVNACKRKVYVHLWVGWGFNDSGEQAPFQGGTNAQVVQRLEKKLRQAGCLEYLKVAWYTGKDQREPIHFKIKARNCHLKFLAVDGHLAVFGSGNMDTQSWFHSQEINVVVDSEIVVREWVQLITKNQSTAQFGMIVKEK